MQNNKSITGLLTITFVTLMGVATSTLVGCADELYVGIDIETGGESNCSDGEDNDDDGLVDCDDPDCSDDPACGGSQPTRESNCSDGVDNDDDGYTDCNDSDCNNDPACTSTNPSTESNCSDGCDNDGDGLVDCDDPDCSGNSACNPSGPTYCWDDDGVDGDPTTIGGTCHLVDANGDGVPGECYSPPTWTDPEDLPRCGGPGNCVNFTANPTCCVGHLSDGGHIVCDGPEF